MVAKTGKKRDGEKGGKMSVNGLTGEIKGK